MFGVLPVSSLVVAGVSAVVIIVFIVDGKSVIMVGEVFAASILVDGIGVIVSIVFVVEEVK